ncbi:hypothetical protein IP80_10335 [beta proteobacterium AAP65]|nr:hypothetical protein IP80_10335 [beta proteobacterium AAP65]
MFPLCAGLALALGAPAPAAQAKAEVQGSPEPVGLGFAPAWHFSGYATLGHAEMRSSAALSQARDQTQSQPRAWEVDSRLGLQLEGQLTPVLGLTAQAVLRPRVPDTPAIHSLEWAFAHWVPRPGWLLRVGRTSPDLFLYADVRNVGIAFPWVRLNPEFYAWMPVQSIDGLDLSHDWAAGEATWRLKLGYAHGLVRVAAQSSGTPGDAQLDAVRLLTLSRDSVASRVKLSVMRARLDLARAPVLLALNNQLATLSAQAAALQLPGVAGEAEVLRQGLGVRGETRYYSLGAQQDLGPWQFTAEWSLYLNTARQTDAQRHYLGVARRFEQITVFAIAGRSKMRDAPLTPPQAWAAALAPSVGATAAAQATALGVAAAQAGNQGRTAQRSVGLGLRWDVAPQLAAKLQWDRTQVDAFGRALWAMKPGMADARPFSARVLSLSLDVSF